MFDTQVCENQQRHFNFRWIWIFLFIFIETSNFKNSMYPQSFFCEEAKIKHRTSSQKQLCKISEEAIWESRFTSFFLLNFYYKLLKKFGNTVMHLMNNALLILPFFLGNVLWKFNINLFIVITIKVWTSFWKFCSQILQINNFFKTLD